MKLVTKNQLQRTLYRSKRQSIWSCGPLCFTSSIDKETAAKKLYQCITRLVQQVLCLFEMGWGLFILLPYYFGCQTRWVIVAHFICHLHGSVDWSFAKLWSGMPFAGWILWLFIICWWHYSTGAFSECNENYAGYLWRFCCWFWH